MKIDSVYKDIHPVLFAHARFCTEGYRAELTPIHFQHTTHLIRLLPYGPHFSLSQTTSSISVYWEIHELDHLCSSPLKLLLLLFSYFSFLDILFYSSLFEIKQELYVINHTAMAYIHTWQPYSHDILPHSLYLLLTI